MVSKGRRHTRRLSVRERRRRKRIYKVVGFFVLLVLLGVLLVYLLRLPHTRIQTIIISGTKELDAELLQKDIEIFLDKPSIVIPQDSYFVFSRSDLKAHLQKRYPRISTIEISVRHFDILEVSIQEYQTNYLAYVKDTGYRVSEGGILLDMVEVQASSSPISFYLNTEYFNPSLGDRILPKEDFLSLVYFIKNLHTLGIHPKTIVLNNTIEYLIVIPEDVKLIINPNDSYATYEAVLREILPYREFGYNFTKSSFSQDVAYINLRYGKKIIYCYVSDPCESNYPLLYE
ncbi:MAG: hypothetical protein ACKKL4_01220 [Patescibacteria group bacterium]